MISMVMKEIAFKRNFSARTIETTQKGNCNGILRFSLEQCGVTYNIDSNGYCEFHKYQHDRKLNPAPTFVQVSIEEARREHVSKSKPKPVKEVKVPEVKVKEPKRAKDDREKVSKATKQLRLEMSPDDAAVAKAVKEAREIEVNGVNKESKRTKLPAVGEVANLAKGEREREIKVTKRKESSKAAEEAKLFKEERERVLRLASEEKVKRANELKQANLVLKAKPVQEETKIEFVKEVTESEKVIEKEVASKEELGAKVAIEEKAKIEPIPTELKPVKTKLRTNGAKSGVDESDKNYEPFYWDSPNSDFELAEGPVWDGELEKVEWIEEPKLATFVHHATSERVEVSKKDNYGDFFENGNKDSVRNGNYREETLNSMRLSRPDKHLQFGHVTERNKQVTQYIFRFEDLPSISASASEKQQPQQQQQQKSKIASDPFSVEWEY